MNLSPLASSDGNYIRFNHTVDMRGGGCWVINRRRGDNKMTPEQRARLKAEYPSVESTAKDNIQTAILFAALCAPIVAVTVAAVLVFWLSDTIIPQIHPRCKKAYSEPL